MTAFRENPTPHLRFVEQASDPDAPAEGDWRVFFKADGAYLIDDAGTVTGPLGTGTPAAELGLACSDETTPIDTTGTKATFRMPYAMTVTAVRASLTTADTTGITLDVTEGGVSILSTPVTIDANETTSTTATTPPVISDGDVADDAEITIDVDAVGDGVAAGLKVWLIGTRA